MQTCEKQFPVSLCGFFNLSCVPLFYCLAPVMESMAVSHITLISFKEFLRVIHFNYLLLHLTLIFHY